MLALTQRDEKKRLGFNGIEEVKNHSFFKDINWDDLLKEKVEAPYVPKKLSPKYCSSKKLLTSKNLPEVEAVTLKAGDKLIS